MCGQQKGQNRAKSHVRLTLKKKKKKKFFFGGIFQIPFQVGNSATFPRSRKITGPTTPLEPLILNPVALYFFRYGCFQQMLKDIETKEPGGLDHYSLSYERFGIQAKSDGSVSCLEWCPGAQDLYLWGDFSKFDSSVSRLCFKTLFGSLYGVFVLSVSLGRYLKS